jgi:CBS domain-containing protein
MIVADVMTRDVIAVQPDTTLADAARIMVHRQISGLPVLDASGRLVGILSEGDLLRRPELGTCARQGNWLKGFNRTEALAAEYVHTHSRRVGDVMTPNPTFVRPDMPLAKATELMLARRVKRLPVLREDRLIGMISRFDMLSALAPRLSPCHEEIGDAEITAAITGALAREPWASRQGVTITVEDGMATLTGRVYAAAEARALRVLVENTPGVRKVEDAVETGEDMDIAAEAS